MKYADRYAALVAAAAYFVLMLSLYSFRDVFEFDPDEGNNVIKALMMSRGHQLYGEIWSDQPPLFTYLLMWWFKIGGWSVVWGRILVLLFASAIVFAVYDSLRLISGHVAALAGALLLPCTMEFMALSVSVMLGLPSIALALLGAWALVRWTRSKRTGWLVAGGVLMGLSLLTKLFAAFILPVLGVWVLLAACRTDGRWSLKPAALIPPAVWSLSVIATAVVLLFLTVSPSDWDQLYDAHNKARSADFFSKRADQYVKNFHGRIEDDWHIATLAGLGLATGLLYRKWPLLVPGAWCLLGYFLIRGHRPIWYHHHVLLSVPACMLAGQAVGAIFSGGWKPKGASVTFLSGVPLRLASVILAVWLFGDVVRGEKKFKDPKPMTSWSDRDRFVAEAMGFYADVTKTVLLDRQMYAFYAGLDIPPNLSVTSQKRLNTGNLTEDDILRVITDQRPEQVVVSWRFAGSLRKLYRKILEQVRDDYTLVHTDSTLSLYFYVRNDVVGDPLNALLRASERVPGFALGHDAVGLAWNRRGETEKATASFRRAMAIDPKSASACEHLADTVMATGNYAGAFDALRQSMTMADNRLDIPIARFYAWRRATCPEPGQRDGAEAERIARGILAAMKKETAGDLALLAAALAAQGRFDEAVEVGERAAQKTRGPWEKSFARQITRQLQAYRRHQAWIEPIKVPTS